MNHIFLNLSKSKKHDVLYDLLVGKSSEGIISKKELNALKRLVEGVPSKKSPVKNNNLPAETIKHTAAVTITQKRKVKTTHYLSQEVSENLDMAQMTIRSLMPEDLQCKISKSEIVNQSLAMILQEFEIKGKNSRLIRTLMQKI